MTLEELKERAESQGFKYAYGGFAKEIEAPYLVATIQDSNNFQADNRVFLKKNLVYLEYCYKAKDFKEQNKIEDNILYDVPWNKTEEVYLSDEKVWQVSYFFEI